MNNDQLEAKIIQIRFLESQIKSLQANLDSLKDDIRHELDERKVEKVVTSGHNVFYDCYERTQVDTAKLKAESLYDMYTKKVPIVSLKITDIN